MTKFKTIVKNKVEVSLIDFNRAKRSVGGRIDRLRHTRWNWEKENSDSPIVAVGVFNDEIDDMEKILTGMSDRLNSASVFI